MTELQWGRDLTIAEIGEGLVGWGEAQAPLAPQVACTIVNYLLQPILLGCEFSGLQAEIEAFWDRMYSAMRVRGQTGGFMLDAISGVDLALCDLAGQVVHQPVSKLIAGERAKAEIPSYISGLPGENDAARLDKAQRFASEGYSAFKIYHDRSLRELIGTFDALQAGLTPKARIAVDALWRLLPEDAVALGHMLDERNALWLECPFMPEEIAAHVQLAHRIRTPIALGESYRTHHELAPFLEKNAVGLVQPDLGRSGITEGLRIARIAQEHGLRIVPHVSIALGPQVAAAIHLAAALPNSDLLEFNPLILEVANCFLTQPIFNCHGHYITPREPGLGARIAETPEFDRFASGRLPL